MFAGSGDQMFHAIDKSTGAELWTFPVTRGANGTPVTYMGKDGRQYVVVATGAGADAVLMAFSVPAN